jgi:hypothetical protein
MPGFFQSLRRMAKGEPIYQPDDYGSSVSSLDQSEGSKEVKAIGAKQATGRKILPRVFIEDIKCEERGDHIECFAKIRNESEYEVFLHDVHVFGVRREINTKLHEGEHREFLIFNDHRPKNAFHKVELQYRDLAGDYFVGMHDLEARRLADGTYTIHRIKYVGLKDI